MEDIFLSFNPIFPHLFCNMSCSIISLIYFSSKEQDCFDKETLIFQAFVPFLNSRQAVIKYILNPSTIPNKWQNPKYELKLNWNKSQFITQNNSTSDIKIYNQFLDCSIQTLYNPSQHKPRYSLYWQWNKNSFSYSLSPTISASREFWSYLVLKHW